MKNKSLDRLVDLGPDACVIINDIELYFDECHVGPVLTVFYMNGTQIATIKTKDIKKLKYIM